jgi:hypothetical protein
MHTERKHASDGFLILSIDVYARPTRGIWAKEKRSTEVDDEEGAEANAEEMDDEACNSEEADNDSDADTNDEGEFLEEKEKKVKTKLTRKGPYGQLQLVQKLLLRSDATLQDLRDSFICRMDDLPAFCEDERSTEFRRPTYTGRKRVTDSVMLIEGQLYDERPDCGDSYATPLGDVLRATERVGNVAETKKMADSRIDSIVLHFGKLYWFIHQGSCEHGWCVSSARVPRTNEAMVQLPSASITTYLQYGYMIRPLVKWSRPGNRVESYSLHQCDICLARTACMVVQGGERFRPPVWSNVKMDGMDAVTKTMCEICWLALTGQQPPTIAQLIDRAGRAETADVSSRSWSRQSGRGWTVIPSLE